jgi:hypothetical protein
VRELWLWRVIAMMACAAWGMSWVSRDEEVPAKADTSRTGEERAVPPPRPSRSPIRRVPSEQVALPLDEGVLERAREEVRSELRARRDIFAERQLYRALDQAAEFGDSRDLGADERQALYGAVREMHEQLLALGPPDPFADPPDPDDLQRARQEPFEALDADLRDALGDQLVDEFLEWMRPPFPAPPPMGRPEGDAH